MLQKRTEEPDILLDIRLAIQNHQWGLLAIGLVLWVVIVVCAVLMVPLVLAVTVYDLMVQLTLKFRTVLSDTIRPRASRLDRPNTKPASEIVTMFCNYEDVLLTYGASALERSAFISKISRLEEEVEAYRLFSAALQRLKVEQDTPNRREAIMSSRALKKQRKDEEINSRERRTRHTRKPDLQV